MWKTKIALVFISFFFLVSCSATPKKFSPTEYKQGSIHTENQTDTPSETIDNSGDLDLNQKRDDCLNAGDYWCSNKRKEKPCEEADSEIMEIIEAFIIPVLDGLFWPLVFSAF